MNDSRTALVTGGAGILGTAITDLLATRGFRVAVVDRDATRIASLEPGRPSVRGYAVDVTDREGVVELCGQIERELGRVELLVNNAASKSDHFFERFEEFPLADWRQVMDSNVLSAVVCSQVFGGKMAKRSSGSIVNILSVYGIVAPDQRIYEGSEYLGEAINTPAVYSASKAALWGLTKYLASYWGGAGVRVNAVTPGGVFSGQNRQFVSRYSERVPLGRMAKPEEIASAVAYLGSESSGYVTGHNLVVDGGLTVW